MPLSVFRGWDDADRAVAIAWAQERADSCPGCGHPLSVTTRPGAARQYEVDVQQCQACMVAEARTKDERDYPGRRIAVHRKPT